MNADQIKIALVDSRTMNGLGLCPNLNVLSGLFFMFSTLTAGTVAGSAWDENPRGQHGLEMLHCTL